MTAIPDKGWPVNQQDTHAKVEEAFPVGCEVVVVVEGEYGPVGTHGRVLGYESHGCYHWHIRVEWESGPYLGEPLGWVANSRFMWVASGIPASSVSASSVSASGFCSCPEPDFIRNCVGGKWFEVCRRCKNERMP